MVEEKNWHKYEPAKGKEKMAYTWRMSARNMFKVGLLDSLETYSQNMNEEYDEYFLKEEKDIVAIRIFGKGNTVVNDPRMEFFCDNSQKSKVNSLMGELGL